MFVEEFDEFFANARDGFGVFVFAFFVGALVWGVWIEALKEPAGGARNRPPKQQNE